MMERAIEPGDGQEGGAEDGEGEPSDSDVADGADIGGRLDRRTERAGAAVLGYSPFMAFLQTYPSDLPFRSPGRRLKQSSFRPIWEMDWENMISIQSSISELERAQEVQAALLTTYLQAIKNCAQYAVELDDRITEPHRRYLTELAGQVASGKTDAVTGSSATFRGLLRDYRDRAARYLQELREELAGTARALQETLDSLAQSAGDHETQLRKSVVVLREVSEEADVAVLRAKVCTAADAIESSLEQVRKEHQLTVAQFLMEMRVLHQRIDSLETAASVDSMTGLYDRGEMEGRIRSAHPGSFHLLLFQVHGISRAEAQFSRSVSEELAAAFAKRLKNSLPETATLGRWSPEEFIALIGQPRDPKSSNRWANAQLSGAYSCLQSGKTVRPSLQVSVGIVDGISRETAERTLDRVKMFLTGAA